MPERLLEGVTENGEPVDVRVGVFWGVPTLLGTRGRRIICWYRMGINFPEKGCLGRTRPL